MPVSALRDAHARSRSSKQGGSPILDQHEQLSLDMEIEAGVCYFSDAVYPIGAYVLSGRESLHYEARSVWVRKGEMRPGDPEE